MPADRLLSSLLAPERVAVLRSAGADTSSPIASTSHA